MSGRERLMAAFNGTASPELPVAPLYLGLYRAPHARRLYLEALQQRVPDGGSWSPDDEEQLDWLFHVLLRTYGIFRHEHDWIDVSCGTAFPLFSKGTAHRRGGRLWWSTPDAKTHEISETVPLGTAQWLPEQPQSREDVDRRLPLPTLDPKLSSWLDQVTLRAVAHYRGRAVLYGAMGTPYWGCYGLFGFAGLMQNVLDRPDLVRHAAERNLMRAERVIQYYRAIGAECVFIEECLSSADLLSPKQYDEFAFPTTRAVLEMIRAHGMKSVFYICGDVMPRLERLAELPFDALGVEESKKGFLIDIGDVRRALGKGRTLFGNIDVCLVRDGDKQQIAAEVRRQLDAAGADGRFVVSIGSPFTLDTPPEKIDLLTEVARELRRS